ncbi:hypothetical protein SMICM17S_01723 [Streptomyces microflavus]
MVRGTGVGGRKTTGFTVHALLGPEQERSVAVRADGVLLATGAYEKVLPFPGEEPGPGWSPRAVPRPC